MADRSSFFDRVYRVARLIPAGRVATYGQIARLAGAPRGARMVGWAMNGVSEADDVPWQRVVNAQGQISLRAGAGGELQRVLLEDEGVEFGINGRIDLREFGWEVDDPLEIEALLEDID